MVKRLCEYDEKTETFQFQIWNLEKIIFLNIPIFYRYPESARLFYMKTDPSIINMNKNQSLIQLFSIQYNHT